MDDSRRYPRSNWALLTALIVLVGVGLRGTQYFSQQSYWNDEASLVLNVFHKTAPELFGRLDYDQASPPLFLLAMRGTYLMFGRGELAMRLLPLLLGIGALILFARLAWMLLPPAIASLTVALFALSGHLITHAAEAKQYSGDAFIATFMLFIALRDRDLSPASERLLRVALLGCVAIWFSHPAAFMFGGIALALLPAALRERPSCLSKIIMAIFAPAASFIILYFVSIDDQHSAMLFEYWKEKFVDFQHPWSIPFWLLRAFSGVFNYAYDNAGPLLLTIGIIGAVGLWRRRQHELLGMLVLPILLTLIAAALHKYPFGGTRLTLFLAPSCLLLGGAGLHSLNHWLAGRLPRAKLIVVAALLAINGITAIYHVFVPRYRGNIRAPIEYVRAHRSPTEHVYVERDEELLTYWQEPDQNVRLGGWPTNYPDERFWIILSYGPRGSVESQLPDELKQFPVIERFETRGGAAMLLSPATSREAR